MYLSGYELITAPQVEPVTLADIKVHLRVEHLRDDSLLTTLIGVARNFVEVYLRRALITQTWAAKYDAFTADMRLPRAPIQSITDIKHLDTDGIERTIDPTVYTFDKQLARLVTNPGQVWPAVYAVPGPITATYVAGYGDNADKVPVQIVHAIKLTVGHFYNNREESIGFELRRLPLGVRSLLGPYQVKGF